ncbi:putative membrane protein YuiD [Vitis vinifera]|uniref:Putative membrane protein YuiD n=1 Tax=Vitis vinifera TaxID=29760 RepID=A0A438DIY0_VITVI|nr:putative membrane protein YuiD [Vitis vinifera]
MMNQDAEASSSTTTSHYSSSSSILSNYPLLAALLSFILAQTIKVFTSWYRDRRWDLKQLVGSGGMPSSHSATVTALAAAIGLQEGFGGSMFAISLVIACVVMYDAFGVRLQAGRQAEVLNQIVYELPAEHPLAESRPLRELLGHTPPQIPPIISGLVPYLMLNFRACYSLLVDVFVAEFPILVQVIAGAVLGLTTASIAYLIVMARSRA